MAEAKHRYVVFGSERYYPSSGWSDLIGQTDDLDEAKAIGAAYIAKENNYGPFIHVVDLTTFEVVHDQDRDD